jgi:hypothetical protein
MLSREARTVLRVVRERFMAFVSSLWFLSNLQRGGQSEKMKCQKRTRRVLMNKIENTTNE